MNKIIEFQPFITACMKNGSRQQAERYLSLLPQYKTIDKVHAHIALGSVERESSNQKKILNQLICRNFVTAARLAFDAKDRDLMRKVYWRSHSNREQRSKVIQLMNAMWFQIPPTYKLSNERVPFKANGKYFVSHLIKMTPLSQNEDV